MEKPIKHEIKDRIGYIVLNRPEKRNALNDEMVEALKEVLNQMEHDPDVKVIVIKANGKAFCAGADLGYLQKLQTNTFEENQEDSRSLKDLFLKIYESPKVIVAQIQGHALAGGCGLASVCDFAFAVPEANFGYTEVRIGFIPAIVLVFLLRKIGEGKAKELLLGGNLISAEKAREMGLINTIVPAEELEQYVYSFAQGLIQNNSEQSMAMTKDMIARVQDKSLKEALDFAASMNAKARGTSDCQKGIAAFLNKEKLIW